MGKTRVTSVMRGCAQYSHSTCSLMNAMLCPLNSTNVCKCGICSKDRCNDDKLKLSSDGAGRNVSKLMINFTSNLTTSKILITTSKQAIMNTTQLITSQPTTAKTTEAFLQNIKTNPVSSFSVRINVSFIQIIIITHSLIFWFR